MICPRCKTEYEGYYCPECGTKGVEDKPIDSNIPKNKKVNPVGVVIALIAVSILILVIGLVFIFGKVYKNYRYSKAPAVTNVESTDTSKKQNDTQKAQVNPFFSDLAMYDFTFASGAGAWSTEMHINEDGTFYGNYHDSDMGDSGDEYPNGTLYYCDFTGKFTEPEKINEYSYRFKIEKLDLAKTPGEEEIFDGIKYIYSEAYGLDEAENLTMYIPGTPVSKLSEELLWWVFIGEDSDDYSVIPFYVLYNESPGYGFFSNRAPEYSSDSGDIIDEDYILFDSNSRYLTESDLMALDKNQLRLARNEIYARHGRIFEDESLQAYFEGKSWYSPLYDKDHFKDNMLNVYEKANALFIKEYESNFN